MPGLLHYVDEVYISNLKHFEELIGQMNIPGDMQIIASAIGSFDDSDKLTFFDWCAFISLHASSNLYKAHIGVLGERTLDMIAKEASTDEQLKVYVCTGIAGSVHKALKHRMLNGYPNKDLLYTVNASMSKVNRQQLDGKQLDDTTQIHQTRKEFIGKELYKKVIGEVVANLRKYDIGVLQNGWFMYNVREGKLVEIPKT